MVDFDNHMNMNENLAFSSGFLLIWIVVYIWVRWKRPNAEKSHKMTSDLAVGSAINFLFWFALLLLGKYLLNSNESFFRIMDLVLDTRIILVPWAYLSYALVAYGFQLDKVSGGKVDWRIGLIIFAICLSTAFGVYYFLTGIPAASLDLP
jgi:hypothetical protein